MSVGLGGGMDGNAAPQGAPAPGVSALQQLAQLNAHIAQASLAASQANSQSPAPGAGQALGDRPIERAENAVRQAAGASSVAPNSAPNTGPWPPLRSAQRFANTWARVSADQTLRRATQRAPDQAGPLNSHRLVLHTLDLMRQLSPDYLHRFLSHTDTLLWLDQALAPLRQAPAKGGKAQKAGAAGRRKKV